MHRWLKRTEMDGPRRTTDIKTPNDPVAFTLLDATDGAIGQGGLRQGMAITARLSPALWTAVYLSSIVAIA